MTVGAPRRPDPVRHPVRHRARAPASPPVRPRRAPGGVAAPARRGHYRKWGSRGCPHPYPDRSGRHGGRMRTTTLGPAERAAHLARMAEQELDVLVVGGGVVGAGTALDAATRGLSVGLVEAHDWACGTSSRASKLIHGG